MAMAKIGKEVADADVSGAISIGDGILNRPGLAFDRFLIPAAYMAVNLRRQCSPGPGQAW